MLVIILFERDQEIGKEFYRDKLKEKEPHKESETEQETENSRHLRSKRIKTNRTIQSHQGRDQEFENCLEKQQANKNEKELQKEHDNSGGSNTQSKRRTMIEKQSKKQSQSTSPGVGRFEPHIMAHMLTIHCGLPSPLPGFESSVALGYSRLRCWADLGNVP